MGEFLLFGLSLGFFSNREFREFKEYSDCRSYSCVGANFPKFLKFSIFRFSRTTSCAQNDGFATQERHSEGA